MFHTVFTTNRLLVTFYLIIPFESRLRSQISLGTYLNHCLMPRDKDILGFNMEIRILELNDSLRN